MKKITVYSSLAALCLGVMTGVAAITLFALMLLNHEFNLLRSVIYLLILCGGAFLFWFGLKSYLLSSQTYEDPATVAAKMREQAQKRLDTAKAEQRKLSSNIIAVIILIAAAGIFLVFYGIAQDVNPVPKSNALLNLHYESAEVLEISEENYHGDQDMEDRPIGEQYVRIKITSGEHAGNTYSDVRNNLSLYYGTVLEVGDSVIVALSDDGETVVLDSNYIYDYNRTTPLAVIILLFLLATILVGGKIGAKSLLGLGLTVLCIFAILFPLLIGGWPTLPTILGLCAYVTIVEFVIMGGVNKKILCAILGTISGVAIAMLFGELSAGILRLTGYQMKDAAGEIEALGQLRQQTLDNGPSILINDLLVGGILIAALGAVNDVAMSISSAMNELVAVNPNLTRKELFKSGMTIGRDMVGTMTNTLILALVGGSFVEILYYSSLDLSFYEIMSTTYFSIEIMQGVASSIGVILAVPLSVVLGVLFFAKRKKS